MTMPNSPGWYDDPQAQDAERYHDGNDWTPQRRRKQSMHRRPTQPPASHGPIASADPNRVAPATPSPWALNPSDGYGAPIHAGPAGPYGPPPPPMQHDGYGPSVPNGPYGAPPLPAPGDYGAMPPFGGIEQPLVTRLRAGMAGGIHRTMGLSIAGVGIALIAASFAVWGKARIAGTTYKGALASETYSFPGLGDPTIAVTYSDNTANANLNVSDPSSLLVNTHPGWMTLLLGIVALIAGSAYLWSNHRKAVATVVVVAGGIVGALCASYFFDLRSTFGDPPDLASADFSPGIGLVGSCILAFALVALGIAAYLIETRRARPIGLPY